MDMGLAGVCKERGACPHGCPQAWVGAVGFKVNLGFPRQIPFDFTSDVTQKQKLL